MNETEHRPALHFEDDLVPLLKQALEERHSGRPARSRIRQPRRWTAASIVVGVLVVALVAPFVLPEGSGGASEAAADALSKMALTASRVPAGAIPEDGQYLYTRSFSAATYLYVTGTDVPNFFFETTTSRELWIGPDGSGRIVEDVGEVVFPTERDRASWVASGRPDLDDGYSTDESYGPGGLSYLDAADLPADPGRLRALIEGREIVGGPPGDWETFALIGDLLRETSVPPAVRAALYEVAADLPGVELVGSAEDALGRSGIAVAYTHAGVRHELIFDERTAELLGESDVLVEDSTVDVESGGPGAIYGLVGPAGTRASSTTYLTSAVVGSTRARPDNADPIAE